MSPVLATSEVRRLARARLRDTQILFWTWRFDGPFYMCGYAVELALKAAICDRNGLSFPQTRAEFKWPIKGAPPVAFLMM